MSETGYRGLLLKGIITVLVTFLAYSLSRAIYNITLHPLAQIPGPKLRGAFHFLKYHGLYKGDFHLRWHELHEKYGDVVRIAPDTVSVIKADAWRDIYGQGNKQPTMKEPSFYYVPPGTAADIISANNEDHARIRRLMNNAFSEQAVRAQEDIMNTYVTLMLTKLNKHALAHVPVDIMKYLNFTTFDITGDLSFDEPFGSLENEDYNHWILNIFESMHIGSFIMIFRAYGIPVWEIIDHIPALRRMRDAHEDYTKEKTQRRLDKKTDRKDFMSYILKGDGERGMTHDEIKETAASLILAGSETSATFLSGAVYYLCKNPEWYVKLREEIDTNFKTQTDIKIASLGQLKILQAIIMEVFRIYPPVAMALPRITPKQGIFVAGTFIPGGTEIGVPQYAAYHSSRSFKDPETFDPTRWMDNEKYADDNRAIVQPFSVGPRNCVGQNLAWAEIRLILVKLLWNFDLEMVDKSRDWENQKVFILWHKPSLMVNLVARHE